MGTGARTRVAVGATFAAQGFGYASIVTAMPGLKDRTGIDDVMISAILLTGALVAAAGSVTAERVARRRSSRSALVGGLLTQAVGLVLVAAVTSVPALVGAFVVFALGLGMVDASGNMQGVALQRRVGRSVMSTLYACLTGAAVGAALLQSGLGTVGLTPAAGAVVAPLVAAVVAAGTAFAARPSLVGPEPGAATGAEPGPVTAGPAPAPARDGDPALGVATDATAVGTRRPPLPRAGIWLFGAVVAAAFVVDSAVSSWSAVYLADVLDASPQVYPLGYAAYQAAVLVTRMVGDPLVRRHGRVRVVAPTAVVAAAGLGVVVLAPGPLAAVVGFALAGVGVGTLVPLAFSAAGELAPQRLDEVVARINLFNYAGAILGAVAVGLLSDAVGLGPAFLLPALLMLTSVGLARHFAAPEPGTRPAVRTTPTA